MITLSKVSKWYPNFQVLKHCSTEVAKGEVVVVCGPSGSGKSTLIKCVNGLEPFQEGAITVAGISVSDPKTNLPKLRARIGMVAATVPANLERNTFLPLHPGAIRYYRQIGRAGQTDGAAHGERHDDRDRPYGIILRSYDRSRGECEDECRKHRQG
jgi:ABC-type iron transport system FetAB ATPase subunit